VTKKFLTGEVKSRATGLSPVEALRTE